MLSFSIVNSVFFDDDPEYPLAASLICTLAFPIFDVTPTPNEVADVCAKVEAPVTPSVPPTVVLPDVAVVVAVRVKLLSAWLYTILPISSSSESPKMIEPVALLGVNI